MHPLWTLFERCGNCSKPARRRRAAKNAAGSKKGSSSMAPVTAARPKNARDGSLSLNGHPTDHHQNASDAWWLGRPIRRATSNGTGGARKQERVPGKGALLSKTGVSLMLTQAMQSSKTVNSGMSGSSGSGNSCSSSSSCSISSSISISSSDVASPPVRHLPREAHSDVISRTEVTTRASFEPTAGPTLCGRPSVMPKKDGTASTAAGCAPQADTGCGTELPSEPAGAKCDGNAPCGSGNGDGAVAAVGASTPSARDVKRLTIDHLNLLMGADLAIRAAVSAVVSNSGRTRRALLMPAPPTTTRDIVRVNAQHLPRPVPLPPANLLTPVDLGVLQHLSPATSTSGNTRSSDRRTATPSSSSLAASTPTPPVVVGGSNACTAIVTTVPASSSDGNRHDGVVVAGKVETPIHRSSSTAAPMELGEEAGGEDSGAVVNQRLREGMVSGGGLPSPSPSPSSMRSVTATPQAKKGRQVSVQRLGEEVKNTDKGPGVEAKEGGKNAASTARTTNDARVSPMEAEAGVSGEKNGGEEKTRETAKEGGEAAGVPEEDRTIASLCGGEEGVGTPMPLKFRPRERAGDVLHPWSLSRLRVKTNSAMLGSGTFGKVLAAYTETERDVAVKVMEHDTSSEDAFQNDERWFEHEIAMLSSVSTHPHVIDLLGIIRMDRRVLMIMPLSDADLCTLLKASGTLNEKQTAYIIRQLLLAVEYMHGKGIVHRDIKPANILILNNKVQLADLGLAEACSIGETIEGSCGTVAYMAPEAVEEYPYGPPVDVWAVGVVAFELLNGCNPFSPKIERSHSYHGRLARHRKDLRGAAAEGSPPVGKPVGAFAPDLTNREEASFSGGTSESSGSFVDVRMVEGSEPAGGRQRAEKAEEKGWLPGRAPRLAEVDVYRLRLKNNIARGKYSIPRGRVGEECLLFIKEVLRTDPDLRLSAAVAAEHAWLGGPTKASTRRRAARAEAGAVSVERAVSSAEIAKARFALSSSAVLAEAAQAVATSGAAKGLTEATEAELSGIFELALTMSHTARAIQKEVKRYDREAGDAEKRGTASGDVEAMPMRLKAEGKVRQVEMLAEQADQSCKFEDAAVNNWEKAIAAVARGDSEYSLAP